MSKVQRSRNKEQRDQRPEKSSKIKKQGAERSETGEKFKEWRLEMREILSISGNCLISTNLGDSQ